MKFPLKEFDEWLQKEAKRLYGHKDYHTYITASEGAVWGFEQAKKQMLEKIKKITSSQATLLARDKLKLLEKELEGELK